MTTPRTVTDVLNRTAQLLQRSNQWTQGSFEEQNTDNQGKTRTCRCLVGAVRVASGLEAGDTQSTENKLSGRAQASLLKTLNSDPTAYGLDFDEADGGITDLVEFNDSENIRHADVLRLVNNTVARIENRG